MRLLLAAITALLCGCATAQQTAEASVAADIATTGVALSIPGVVEGNPLAVVGIPLRLAIIEHARHLPIAEGTPILHAVSAASFGAAANNLLVIAGAGAFAPILGLMVGLGVWASGDHERRFWVICEAERAKRPGIACIYNRG